MRTKIKNLLLIIFVILFIFSCETEQPPKVDDELIKTNEFTIEINRDALVGEWVLSEMLANRPVDIDGNGTSSKNILIEADCFNSCKIVFYNNGDFTTTNARLNLNAGNNSPICEESRNDTGTWNIERDAEGDFLLINLNIEGYIYTEKKRIVQKTDVFAFGISKFESERYITDPGNSSLSGIQILFVEYSKQ